jgi:hypothetical protein
VAVSCLLIPSEVGWRGGLYSMSQVLDAVFLFVSVTVTFLVLLEVGLGEMVGGGQSLAPCLKCETWGTHCLEGLCWARPFLGGGGAGCLLAWAGGAILRCKSRRGGRNVPAMLTSRARAKLARAGVVWLGFGGVLILAAGCTAPITKRAAAFSAQAAPAITSTRAVYALVETTNVRRRRMDQIAAYDTTAFDAPAAGRDFAQAADFKERAAILDLLQRYIDELAAVSGDRDVGGIDEESKAAAASMGALAKTGLPALTHSKQAALSTDEVTAAGLAIDALGRVLLERQRARALPAIVAAADSSVATLCMLLREDIGEPETAGLRMVLRVDYEGMETAEDAAIRDHPREYSYPEKRAAVDELYALVDQQALADSTLAKAGDALAGLAKAHAALAASARDHRAPGFAARLLELKRQAGQLEALQQAMGAGSKTVAAGAIATPAGK